MSGAQQRVVELMKAFIRGRDRSLSAAGELEDALLLAFPEDDDAIDLIIALASYRPVGGPHLYDQREILTLLTNVLPVIEKKVAPNEDAG
jgi:hypothetical protein